MAIKKMNCSYCQMLCANLWHSTIAWQPDGIALHHYETNFEAFEFGFL